jgi:hypothetical protein
MDDKERRHLDAAFLWLSRKHSGFAGGNPTSVIRILLSIEKDLRAIERAATVAPDYSRADFLRGFTKVFATKSRSRFPITKRGAAESKDDVTNAYRDQKIGRCLDAATKRSRHARIKEMKKLFGIKRSRVYEHWNNWKARAQKNP